ncbi:GLPGLI family protein [Haloflavibacter putidus]|uniref:GLPGLI family protein n=1 Tax=Haloflavibacter putidus TaxID=2576776 RepID=A0A507ZUR7_9FLAO|nr:GLPGLI family protein [Haloflavibacter putidus]TQD40697.1 GLPGLI family protein [Haloflavibacter putidus]
MINRNIVLIFLLVFSFTAAWSQQSGKVVYRKKMDIQDTMFTSLKQNNPEENEHFLREAKKMAETIEKFSYELLFWEHEAIFEQQEILLKNSMYAGLKNMEGINYTNLETEKTLEQVNVSGSFFLVNRKKADWEITKESKTISGFKCIKAISKKKIYDARSKAYKTKDIVAWFTPEIPVSFGPKGYFGLPGLIIELKVAAGTKFYVTDLDLSPQHSKIEKPRKGREVSEMEFKEIMKELNTKFFNMSNNN